MLDIVIMGEMIVEIMRDREDSPLNIAGMFRGPYPSGAPAVCIDAAARLGCSTAIIGGVGQDDFGRCLLERLNRDGVDTSRVIQSEESPTGCAFVTCFSDGARDTIFHMGNSPAARAKAPREGSIEDANYMHIMGCSLMVHKAFTREILKTMRMFRRRGTRISFDPNFRRELFPDKMVDAVIREVMENTSVFMPEIEDLLMVTGEGSVEAAIQRCFAYPDMKIICLKKGDQGFRIYTRDRSVEIGEYKGVQADVAGTVACFDGAFLAGLCQGGSVEEAARMGAAASALTAVAYGPMEGEISTETIRSMIE